MNISIWCKSFLSIYNIIPNITRSIDKLILIKGVNSASTSFEGGKDSTLSQFESVINLSQKKINLINMKVLTDETLLEMDKAKSKILILKYIDNMLNQDIIDVLKLSRRTFFRRIKEALNEFVYMFSYKLKSKINIYQEFLKENLLEDIFFKIDDFKNKRKCEDDNISQYSENICTYVVNKIKKVV